MKKPHQVSTTVAHGFRANEGLVLDLNVRNLVGVDGSTRTTFDVNLGSAEVPTRRYAADVANVSLANHEIRIIFGQGKLGAKGLRTALVVRINPIAAAQFVEVIDSLSPQRLKTVVENMRIVPEALVPIDDEPSQVVEFVANLATIGVAGYESCIDFYHASPFGYKIDEKAKIAIEPVVRVDLRTALFVSVVEEMRAVGKSISADRLPERETA